MNGEYKTLQENQSLNLEYQRNKELRELKQEIERLNNIINEAIDYIELIQYNESYGVKEKDYLKLLDILDKGNKNE